VYLSILAALIVSGLLTAYVNSQRGYSGFAGFVVGFALGPVGFVLALISTPNRVRLLRRDEELEVQRVARGERQQCPYCAEVIRPAAKVCRYCGRELQPGSLQSEPPESERVPIAGRTKAGESRRLTPAVTAPGGPTLRLGHGNGAGNGQADGQVAADLSVESVRHLLRLLDALAQRVLYADTGQGWPPTALPDEENSRLAVVRQDRRSAKRLSLDDSGGPVPHSPLDKERLSCLIDNQEIPEVAAGLNLQRNEKCHFACRADWYELTIVEARSPRRGADEPICTTIEPYFPGALEGCRTISPQAAAPAHIDSGRVFVTNKRLIFLGGRQGSSMALSEILAFTAYQKGVEVQRESGNHFFLAFPDEVDVFVRVLDRVMLDDGWGGD
jgi:hypothetical protein